MSKRQALLFAVLNTLAYLVMVTMNAMANALPINGMNTGELSDMYPNLFVPAGLTFSIWGLIYTLLLIMVIYQFVSLRYDDDRRVFIRRINPWFYISCLLNALWIVAWHYEQVVTSLIIMLMLLLSLIAMYTRLGIGKRPDLPGLRYLVHLPLSIYLGWISIATIANVTALLVDAGWGRWGIPEQVWTVVMLLTGAVLAGLMIFRQNDIYYALVVMWAFAGIFIRRFSTEPYVAVVALSAIVLAGLILLAIVLQLVRRKAY